MLVPPLPASRSGGDAAAPGGAARLPVAVAGLLAAAWVLANLRAPLVEDSLFWWVPKGLLAAEQGPRLVLDGPLPAAMRTGGPVPPQWAGGLPDYAHPPLWAWWLGLALRLSPSVEAVHLAALPAAVLAAAGFAALGARLGNRWSGLAVFALPPFLAQLLRADLDLPLLAVVPWAMVALIRGRWGRFAALGLLAPWLKEPGVLLAAPAVLRAWRERRWRPAALAPLAGLAAWGLLHRLAEPERLPASPLAWLGDLAVAGRLVFLEQGRWLLLLGLPWSGRLLRRPPARLALALGLVWTAFFAAVGFFATRGALAPLTHVRYFLPGMAVLVVVLAGRWPWLALLGLAWLRAPSPFGPEASLYGLDAARAERDAAPWIAEAARTGEVWVGSYQAAALTQPWAGQVAEPVRGIRVYGPDTDPAAIPEGAVVVLAAYGEPAGRLAHALAWEEAARWRRGSAVVRAMRVTGHRPEPAPAGRRAP